MKRLTKAIKLILRAQSVMEDVERDMVDEGSNGEVYRSVGLPTDREMLRDCMDRLDNIINDLEYIQM